MANRSDAPDSAKVKHTTVRLPRDLFDALDALARENERTVSAELRLAARRYVAAQDEEPVAA